MIYTMSLDGIVFSMKGKRMAGPKVPSSRKDGVQMVEENLAANDMADNCQHLRKDMISEGMRNSLKDLMKRPRWLVVICFSSVMLLTLFGLVVHSITAAVIIALVDVIA